MFLTTGKIAVALAALITAGGLMLTISAANTRAIESTIETDSITFDGDFSDWPEEAQIIDESGEEPLVSTPYCWDESSWVEVASDDNCATYLYHDESQVDLLELYFGTSATDMYVGFTTAWPMQGVYNVTEDAFESIYDLALAGTITSLPKDFDHNMVFAFGPSGEEVYTNYLVANITLTSEQVASMAEFGDSISSASEDRSFLEIYEESGDTAGFQEEEDTLIGSVDSEDSETNMDGSGSGPDVPQASLEIRQALGNWCNLTDKCDGNFGYQVVTQSETGDSSDRVVVTINSAQEKPSKVKEKKLKEKKIKSKTATLSWQEVDTATSYDLQVRKCKNDSGKKCVKKNDFAKKKNWKKFNDLTTTSKVVKKLKPDFYYQWRVRACNETGCGEYTDWNRFQTAPKSVK